MKVLITDQVDNYMVENLKKAGLYVDYMPDIQRPELENIIDRYNVLVVRSRTKVDSSLIQRGKNLLIIARAGIGLDNIDTDAASQRGIRVVYAPGASTDSAVELTIGLMIAGARNMCDSASRTKRMDFKKNSGVELAGKTLGVVGFGRIGTKVATIARAMGMEVRAYDVIDVHDRAREVGARQVDLDTLLKESDVISFHVTVGKDAKPIINSREFELMKNGAILVNTSRAVAINGPDLLNALETGKVGHYATDVFWHEPPKEEWEIKILNHPRVTVTAHIGAQTKEAQYRVAVQTTQNLLKAVQEVIGENVVNTRSS